MKDSPALRRIIEDDAVGQLYRGDGRMVQLGSEDGVLKLDWVHGIDRLLAHPEWLAEVEQEADELSARGTRHLIWAGMGGSIMAVRVLNDLGLADSSAITIHPLDSTDPAALNAIVLELAAAPTPNLIDINPVGAGPRAGPPPAGGPGHRLDTSADGSRFPAPSPAPADPQFLNQLLRDVLMVGVAMGMTSEEPLTHLEWFAALLADAGLPAEEHLLVMALPGSYLDRFAVERHIPRRLLQLDGDAGTPGRFSAPTTRVFLLPAAIHLAGGTEGGLEAVLSRARELHDPDGALSDPAHHSAALLAAALSDSSTHGACRLLLRLPPPWRPLFPWIEQLLEESLGKGGKGVVAFADQPVAAGAGAITVNMASAQSRDNNPDLQLQLPCPSNVDLATVAAAYLDWQLTTALYGWLEDIKFAGQPAVENYKSRAAALRRVPDPLAAVLPTAATVDEGSLHMLTPPGISGELSVAAAISPLLNQATPLSFLDLTINGELPPALWLQIDREWWAIGRRLNLPVKLRRAPSAYHATEQSEMDGPPPLLSLRLLWRLHQPPLLGVYSDHFLQCQAMATWQAMIEVGRPCFLLVHDGDAAAAAASLLALLPALFSPIP